MISKKGSGQFEMIMAFVFFIGFVTFMFIVISPWDNGTLPKSAVEGLYSVFWQETKIPLSTVFVKANYSGAANCFYINLPSEIFREQDIGQGSSRVTRLGGVEINSSIDGDSLNFERDDNSFRVAISPEFEQESLTSCLKLEDFELGGVVELDVVSFSKFADLRSRYYSDYESLKKDLRVADIFDFAIVVDGLPELSMKPKEGISNGGDIIAKDYVVKILSSDGELSNERVSLRIW